MEGGPVGEEPGVEPTLLRPDEEQRDQGRPQVEEHQEPSRGKPFPPEHRKEKEASQGEPDQRAQAGEKGVGRGRVEGDGKTSEGLRVPSGREKIGDPGQAARPGQGKGKGGKEEECRPGDLPEAFCSKQEPGRPKDQEEEILETEEGARQGDQAREKGEEKERPGLSFPPCRQEEPKTGRPEGQGGAVGEDFHSGHGVVLVEGQERRRQEGRPDGRVLPPPLEPEGVPGLEKSEEAQGQEGKDQGDPRPFQGEAGPSKKAEKEGQARVALERPGEDSSFLGETAGPIGDETFSAGHVARGLQVPHGVPVREDSGQEGAGDPDPQGRGEKEEEPRKKEFPSPKEGAHGPGRRIESLSQRKLLETRHDDRGGIMGKGAAFGKEDAFFGNLDGESALISSFPSGPG